MNRKPRARLPQSVVVLGLVSLFTDASTEMIFPLLPALLAARVGAVPLLLGTMEGLAELVASIFKYYSGRLADRARRLKPLVVFGYSLASAVRPLMAFITRWWHPLLIRSADRIGKGLRTSPRDALIAQWAPEGSRGRAFGFHRAMDHAGAAVGSILALALVAAGLSLQSVILLAWIPGAIAVGVVLWVRDPPATPDLPAIAPGPLAPVPKRLAYYLVPVTLFGLGNSTDAFLLLKLTELGARPQLLPLAWLVLHAVKSSISMPAGALADRFGTARLVTVGWGLYALSYGLVAFARSIPQTFAVIAFYGLYHALSEGAEKSLLTELSPRASRGRAFGLYHGLAGVSALAAGVLFGTLWQTFGSRTAFLTAGGLALMSAVLLVALLPRARAPRSA